MTTDSILKQIAEVGIVPVIRAATIDEGRMAVDAVRAGGISVVEITMTVPGAADLIKQVAKEAGNSVLIGAGTVTTADQAKLCFDNGAQFLVSPGFSSEVVRAAQDRKMLSIPGILTPTELMTAVAHGVNLVKVFPCGNVGGAKYLKALKGPFPKVEMIPTGGVSLSNVGEFLAAGAYALGIGGELVDAAALRAGNSKKVEENARQFVEAVRSARASK